MDQVESDNIVESIREVSRCTGHCCRLFTIPASPEDLAEQEARHAALARREAPDGPAYTDGPQIAAMVTYVGWFDRSPVTGGPGGGHFYSCNNLGEDGNCRIYDERPSMCREYPYRELCQFQGCTMRMNTALVRTTR